MTNALNENPAQAIFQLNYWLGLLGSMVVGVAHSFLLYGLITNLLSRIVANQYVGRQVGLAGVFKQALPGIPRLMGAIALSIPIGIILFVWLLVPCVGWFTGLGMFAVFSWLILPILVPVVVLENNGLLDSFQRAWFLVRRRFWWMLGLFGVLTLLNLLISVGPTMAFSFLLGMLPIPLRSSNPAFYQQLVQSVGAIFSTIVFLPLFLVVFPLSYFDLRVRTEGLDMILASDETNDPAQKESLIASSAIMANEKMITNSDIGNLVALSMIFIALLGLYFAVIFGAVWLLANARLF